jgi:hypothetical protein
VERLKMARGTMLFRGPHFEYHQINLKGVVRSKNWRNLEGCWGGEGEGGVQRSPMKSKRSVEWCVRWFFHTRQESYYLLPPYVSTSYTSNNHASALLHVFLSLYIIANRCLVLLLLWSCWKFFIWKHRTFILFQFSFLVQCSETLQYD